MDTSKRIKTPGSEQKVFSLLVKAVLRSSCSHGFALCPKPQAVMQGLIVDAHTGRGLHYRKGTLNLGIRHFYSKQKQASLTSALKLAHSKHFKKQGCSDVWVGSRQAFSARTHRTFRAMVDGLSHHPCPKQLQIRGTPGSVPQTLGMLLCPALGRAQVAPLP